MQVREETAQVFQCDDDDRSFVVSHMVDKIVLYGEIYGDQVNQMFSYSGEFTKEGLQKTFPTRQHAARYALLHTRGVLDKKKVQENALELHKDGVLDALRMQALIDLLSSCNCAPTRFIEKLAGRGYLDVISRLGIYQESPEMTSTTEALMDFINSM